MKNFTVSVRALGLVAMLGMGALMVAPLALAQPQASQPKAAMAAPKLSDDPELLAKGKAAFVDVARVLQSPRCMNCHPKGDAPLQTDLSTPHAMNISRASEAAGLKCSTCHREQNADAVGAPAGAPPGAPNWHLPSKEMPLIFEGRSVSALCLQLRDPAQNGHKTLDQLVEHVSHDALVLWGWNPGKGRTLPPLKHADFVARFKAWAAAGGPCPE